MSICYSTAYFPLLFIKKCTSASLCVVVLEMCKGMRTQVCQNGNGNGTRDNGNGKSRPTRENGKGNGYFFMRAKIPFGRLDANAIQ